MHGQQNIKIIHSQFSNIGLKAGEDVYYVIFFVNVLAFLRVCYFGWDFSSGVCGMCLHANTQCGIRQFVAKFVLRCFP